MNFTPEPSNISLFLVHSFALLFLLVSYLLGIWSRSYWMPAPTGLQPRQQFIATPLSGILIIGLYARSAFAAMAQSSGSIVVDCAVMTFYALLIGVLSREGAERSFSAIARLISAAYQRLSK